MPTTLSSISKESLNMVCLLGRRFLYENPHFRFKFHVKEQIPHSVSQLKYVSSCLLASINRIFSKARLKINNTSTSSKDDFWIFWGCFCGVWRQSGRECQSTKKSYVHTIDSECLGKLCKLLIVPTIYFNFLIWSYHGYGFCNTLPGITTHSFFQCLACIWLMALAAAI